jgi:hypothetical protein
MKKTFKLFALFACMYAVSCTNQNKLPESTIKDLVTEELNKENLLNQYATIEVGYYEENDEDERYELRKLAAAGVISYKVERIEAKVRVRDGYTYDYNTYRVVDKYKTVTRYKYFVETALTPKGDSLAVAYIPRYEAEPDEYLQYPEFRTYPEDAVSREEVFDDEGQPVEIVEDEKKTETETEEVTEKPAPKTDYDKAKAKEHKETKYVKTHSLKVTDARNILVREGVATADVIVDSYDVSPFGRILKYEREGMHEIYEVSFVYYQDKGWAVTKMED